MPIIKSAEKRVKVATKANIRNAKTKRTMREAIKAFSKALAGGNAKDIEATQKAAASAIDQAAKKAVVHKNKAARQKAKLASQAKAAGFKIQKTAAKPSAKKTATAKPATKKPAAKKTAAKKPTKKA